METIIGFAVDTLKQGGVFRLVVLGGQWLLILLTALFVMDSWGYDGLQWEVKDFKITSLAIWMVELFKLLSITTIAYLATTFIIALPERIGGVLVTFSSAKAKKEVTKKYPEVVVNVMRIYGAIRFEKNRMVPGKRPHILSALMRDIAFVDKEDKADPSPISYRFSGLFLCYAPIAQYLNVYHGTHLSIWSALLISLGVFSLSWVFHRLSIWLFESEDELQRLALFISLKQWLSEYRVEHSGSPELPANNCLEFEFMIKNCWTLSSVIANPDIPIRAEVLEEETRICREDISTLLILTTEPIQLVIREFAETLTPHIYLRHLTTRQELFDLIENIRAHLYLNVIQEPVLGNPPSLEEK